MISKKNKILNSLFFSKAFKDNLKNEKVLLSFSSGLDSTAILETLKKIKDNASRYDVFKNLHLITFKKTSDSIEASNAKIYFEKNIRTFDNLITHSEVDMITINDEMFKGIKLDMNKQKINRNYLYLLFLHTYAYNNGFSTVMIGAHKDDFDDYSDCRPENLYAFWNVLNMTYKLDIKLEIPLRHMTKNEIADHLINFSNYSITFFWKALHFCYKKEKCCNHLYKVADIKSNKKLLDCASCKLNARALKIIN